MKHGHSFAVGMLALLLTACGGGGSQDSSSSVNPGNPVVEAVIVGNAADATYKYQDPLSLETSDSVQFQLVSYDSGTRTVLSDVTWRTSDASSTYGTLSASNGAFTASPTRTYTEINRPLVVTARYNDADYSASYLVNPRQVRVLGRVLVQGTLASVQGAIVDVYGPSNASDPTTAITRLATVTTASNGTFRVSVRATNDTLATGTTASPLYFTVRSSSITSQGFFDSFFFRGNRYDSDSTACLAALTNTDATPLTTGDRMLIDTTVAASSSMTKEELNGTILVTPNTGTRPSADGCIDPSAG